LFLQECGQATELLGPEPFVAIEPCFRSMPMTTAKSKPRRQALNGVMAVSRSQDGPC
jgi:hypothetical protein